MMGWVSGLPIQRVLIYNASQYVAFPTQLLIFLLALFEMSGGTNSRTSERLTKCRLPTHEETLTFEGSTPSQGFLFSGLNLGGTQPPFFSGSTSLASEAIGFSFNMLERKPYDEIGHSKE